MSTTDMVCLSAADCTSYHKLLYILDHYKIFLSHVSAAEIIVGLNNAEVNIPLQEQGTSYSFCDSIMSFNLNKYA